MSFTLGSFDTAAVPGLKATLTKWPALPTTPYLEELPAGEGSAYLGSRLEAIEWEFALEITGSDVASVMTTATSLSGALNPATRGLQKFIPNAAYGWEWQGVVSSPIEWDRHGVLWFSTEGICVLKGTVTITTPNPHGTKSAVTAAITAAGNIVLNLPAGNTHSYPVIKFRGVLTAAQSVLLGTCLVRGPLTSAQTLVLDFAAMDFYIITTSTGAKVTNVADRFDTFERLRVMPGSNTIAASSNGGFTRAEVSATPRRI